MPSGTAISRHCLLVLQDGRVVVDWENSLFQDVVTGDFMRCAEADISHQAQDDELEILRLSGSVQEFDTFLAYLYPLPEQNRRTLD